MIGEKRRARVTTDLPTFTNAIQHAKHTIKIPVSDGCYTVISKIAVSACLPRRYFGLFKECENAHGSFATSIITTSRYWSHTQAEEVLIFRGEY